MPISHICPHCGTELGRTAPVPDPAYGLPLVMCPRCGRHTPRQRPRRHPLPAMGRAVRRTTLSLLLLGASAAVLLMFVGFVAGLGEELGRSLDRHQIGPRSLLLERDAPFAPGAARAAFAAWWSSSRTRLLGLSYVAAVLGAGAYLRSAVGHCHALLAMAVFVAAVAAISAWSRILALIDAPFTGATPTAAMWTSDALLPAVMAVPVVLGFPLGAALRWLARAAQRNAWFAMLRAARRRRAAA